MLRILQFARTLGKVRAPSEPCVPVDPAHGSSKPRGRRGVKCRFPGLAGLEPALAGDVHEAGLVIFRRTGPAVWVR